MTNMEEEKSTSNKTVLWKLRREHELRCGRCKPHQVENATKQPKPDKYKNKRK